MITKSQRDDIIASASLISIADILLAPFHLYIFDFFDSIAEIYTYSNSRLKVMLG